MITKEQFETYIKSDDPVTPRLREVAEIVAKVRNALLNNYTAGLFEPNMIEDNECFGFFFEDDYSVVHVYWNEHWDMDVPRLRFPTYYLWTDNDNIDNDEIAWITCENHRMKCEAQARQDELDKKEEERIKGRARIFGGDLSQK